MAEDGEIAVTIVAEEEANVAATQQVEKVATDPALSDLKAQYQELEKKNAEFERLRNEAETRRAAAEQEASKHRHEAETAKKRETSSHLDTITTAISGSEQEVEASKAAIRSAKVNGDIEAEIEAQDRLAKARATLIRLDEAKQDIEARIKAPHKPQVPTDPVEAFAQSRSPQSAAWIRAHPEYVRSDKGIRKLTAADAVAQAEDLVPDTPEYFARVEEYLGMKKVESPSIVPAQAPTEAAQVAPQPKRTAAPPVAPGSSVSSSTGGAVAQVTLTKGEAAAAVDGTHVWHFNDPNGKFKKNEPIGVNEFARRKLAMMKDGRYDRSFSEN